MNRLTEFLPSVISTVSDVLSKLMEFAVNYLPKLLPQLMTAAVALLTGALQAIKDNIKQIAETVKGPNQIVRAVHHKQSSLGH